MEELSFEALEEMMKEKAKGREWARVVGFYRRALESEDIPEKIKNINFLVQNLAKKGYIVSREAIIQILEKRKV